MRRVVNLDLEARAYATPQPVRINTNGNPCRVPGCDKLAGDGYICPSCVEEWEVHLGNMTALVEDLEIAERKAVRFAPAGSLRREPEKEQVEDRIARRHNEIVGQVGKPEPADMTAGYWLDRLRDELTGQIRIICDTGHIQIPQLRNNPVAMSRWLLRQSARLPKLERATPIEGEPNNGADLVVGLALVVRDSLNVIDAPARRKYVRSCEACSLAVWARGEQATARCACGAEYDVEAEHEARMMVAREAWVTLAEASASAQVKLDTVKKWVRRGRLDAHGDPQRVRYGDVLDLAQEAKERSA